MHSWTTTHLPGREQYGYWREVLCEAFTALNPVAHGNPAGSQDFPSQVHSHDFLDITVSRLQSCAQTVHRGAAEIARQPGEYFFANLQLTGTCVIRQDGRETVANPGDLYLVDTTRPYALRLEQDQWSSLSCRVPHHRITPLLLQSPREATAVCLTAREGMGRVAAGFVRHLGDCPDDVPDIDKALLASQLSQLLAAAVGANVRVSDRSADAVRRGAHAAIVQFIEDNLADHELCVASVAARFRISPRYLHKLFEGTGRSFAQTVQERRLVRCAETLRRMDTNKTVSELAYQGGFGDLSNFCRAFHRRFGMTASVYRHAPLADMPGMKMGPPVVKEVG